MKQLAWLSRYGPALTLMVIIFMASSVPGAQMPNAGALDLYVKKGGHMTGYALLGLALVRAQGKASQKQILLAILGCALYALSDEFHQTFTAGRHPSLVDVGIDLVGTSLGMVVLTRLTALRKLILVSK